MMNGQRTATNIGWWIGPDWKREVGRLDAAGGQAQAEQAQPIRRYPKFRCGQGGIEIREAN